MLAKNEEKGKNNNFYEAILRKSAIFFERGFTLLPIVENLV